MAGSTPPQNYCRMQSPALTQVITTESNTPSRFSSLPRLLRKKRDGSDSSQEGKKERDKQDDSDLQKPPIHKSPSTNKARRWSLFSGGALSPAHSPLVVLLRTRAQMLATKFMRCRQQQASPTGNRPRCQCDSAAIPSQVSPSLSLPLSRSHVFSLALSLVCPHHTMSCPDQPFLSSSSSFLPSFFLLLLPPSRLGSHALRLVRLRPFAPALNRPRYKPLSRCAVLQCGMMLRSVRY